jgi:hypothetical protein
VRVTPDPPVPRPGVGVNVRTSAILAGAVGLAKAALGIDLAPAETRVERRRLCAGCEHRKGPRCGVCNCLIVAKVRGAASSCPLPEPRWGPVPKVD